MRTPDQVRWDFVQDWLRKADGGTEATRILVREELDDYEVAAFHAQQAAEKLIKAYLVTTRSNSRKRTRFAPSESLSLPSIKALPTN